MSQRSFKIYGIELRWIIIGACYLIMCVAIMYPDMRATMSLPAFLVAMALGAFWSWLFIILVVAPFATFIKKAIIDILKVDTDNTL